MRCNLLNPFRECVAGFVDTLPLFKNVLPERKTYSQESLVTDLLGVSYEAHDSLEDVRALQKLVAHVNVSSKEIYESSFTVDYAHGCSNLKRGNYFKPYKNKAPFHQVL